MRGRIAIVLVTVVVAASCGGGGTDTTTTTVTSLAVEDLADVEEAVVRVVASGDFTQPPSGTAHGSGIGVLLGPNRVLTTNQAVAGAASIEVEIAGEDAPVPALLLGASECADLAMLELERSGFPYLRWSFGAPDAGDDAHLASFGSNGGFSLRSVVLGEEVSAAETALTSGAGGLALDGVPEPGTPVVGDSGRLLAIGFPAANGAVAYPEDEIDDLIEALEDGEFSLSIGVNGEVVEAGGRTGVWVSAVVEGSPAAEAGVLAGDLITGLQGWQIGRDGTMAQYCSVLAGASPGEALPIEVWRDGTPLMGTVNGDQRLPSGTGETVTTTMATEPSSVASTTEPEAGGPVDVTVELDGSGDYASLEEATASVPAGSTVRLGEGEFAVSGRVVLDRDLNLIGTGPESTTVRVDGGDLLLSLTRGSYQITGIAFVYYYTGDDYTAVVGTSDARAVLSDVKIWADSVPEAEENLRSIGLAVTGESMVTLQNVEVAGSGGAGIIVTETSELVMDSTLSLFNRMGLVAYGDAVVTMTRSTVQRNRESGLVASDSASCTLEESLVIDNTETGIVAMDDARVDVLDSELTGSPIMVMFGDNATGRVLRTTIDAADVAEPGVGIVVHGSASAVVRRTSIKNFLAGIYLRDSAEFSGENNKLGTNQEQIRDERE